MWKLFSVELGLGAGIDTAGDAAVGGGVVAGSTSLIDVAGGWVNLILYIVGIAAVVMIIVGGIRYATSAGNEKSVTGAKNTIIYALIGLAAAMLAWVIVNFVIGALGFPSGTTPTTSVSSFASSRGLTALDNNSSATRQGVLDALYVTGGGTGDKKQWACNNGYFIGTGAGACVDSLSLDDSITRQDMAVILVRWMAKNGYTEAVGVADNTTSCPYGLTFSDRSNIADYAKCAAAFLNSYRSNGDPTKAVMVGIGGNNFAPEEKVRNIDVLRMLCRVKDNSCWD